MGAIGERELFLPYVVGSERLPIARSVTKRALDMTASATLLVLLSPLFLIVACAVILDSGWPPLYGQPRAGLDGKHFTIRKFRTMVRNADALKAKLMPLNEAPFPAFKIRKDPRITRLGRFLRKTSIDELPQLWNVLMGDMSLVGPRPLPVAEAALVSGPGRARLMARPGITCTWQISNRHTANDTFEDWVAKDLDYIEHWSLRLDLTLLVRTAGAVFRMTGS